MPARAPTKRPAAKREPLADVSQIIEGIERSFDFSQSPDMKAEFVPIEELEEALRIDRDALEDALFEQPDVFHRVSKALAFAISRRDAASQDLKETMAEQDATIRHKAAVVDERITEKEVESQKLLSKTVQTAQDELHYWNVQVGQYQALKEAFNQRSYVLRELVQLWLAGYFGDVVEKRRNSDVRQRLGEEAREQRGRDYKGNR